MAHTLIWLQKGNTLRSNVCLFYFWIEMLINENKDFIDYEQQASC